jgi:hypothetical protein
MTAWHDDPRQLIAALHMLHDEAHGGTPWATCTAAPCRDLRLPTATRRGPAPLSLPLDNDGPDGASATWPTAAPGYITTHVPTL